MENKIDDSILGLIYENQPLDKEFINQKIENCNQTEINLHTLNVIKLVNTISKTISENKESLSNISAKIITVGTLGKIKSSKKLNFYIRTLFVDESTNQYCDLESKKEIGPILKAIEECNHFDIEQAGTLIDTNTPKPLVIKLEPDRNTFYEVFLNKNILTSAMKYGLEKELISTSINKKRNKI